MRSRYFLIALPLLAAAALPAAAQDVVYVSGTGELAAPYEDDGDYASYPDDYVADNNDAGMTDMADKISDPAVQEGVAAIVEQTAGAMMNMPIGPLAEAIERARPGTVDRRLPRDPRLGDLAGRNARYLPEELGDRSRDAMAMMSGFARAMAVMMPEFERMGRDMDESFRAAKAEARRSRN